MVHGTDTIPLEMFCTVDMTLEQLLLTAQTLGLPPEAVLGLGVCVYTSLSPQALGMAGETYTLIVDKDEHHLHASTKVNFPVPLDSLWFASPSGNPLDSLGFIYGNMTDPDSLGNAYRWSAKRISHYPQWITKDIYLRGQQKDLAFISPMPSVYDDEFLMDSLLISHTTAVRLRSATNSMTTMRSADFSNAVIRLSFVVAALT